MPQRTQALIGMGFAVLAIAGLAAWYSEWRAGDPARASRPFRVGYEYSPPNQLLAKDGSATGPAIQVFTEASRRRGIPIQWVFSPEGPEPALRSGKVDLWPVLGDIPERRTFLHISNPWLGNSYWIASLQDAGAATPSASPAFIVAHAGSNIDVRLARRAFPAARLIHRAHAADVLEMVCLGRADAGIIGGRQAPSAMLWDLAACRDHRLRYTPLPNGRIFSGIGALLSRTDASRAADAISTEIGKLTTNGTLSKIYFEWSMDPNNEALVVQYLTQARARNRAMSIGLAAMLGSLGLFVWQTVRVRKARRIAERANAAKSEFLANMSHEIRTPMSSVIGMTGLAMESESRQEQLQYLEMVRSSGHALLTVINDILDFSKIEAGKLDLDPIPFALRDTIARSLRAMALRAHEKGLELLSQIAGDVPDALIGDPGRLRQILLNLAGNALKFTEQGEVELQVRLQQRTARIATLHFSLRDTGIGIPIAKQAAVFDAFSQADGSTTRRYGGTGLGLSISKRLAGMMGGAIWLESVVGRGTTMHFTADFEIGAETPPVALEVLGRALAGLRVLIVDDNAGSRRILAGSIEKLGMVTASAESGAAGLAAIERDTYDVMLLDAQMPEMDGVEVAAQVAQRWPRRRMKILVLTSIGQRWDGGRSGGLPIDAFLSKPIQDSELIEAIAGLFAVNPLSRAGGPALSEPIAKNEARLDILVAEDNPVNQILAQRILEKLGHKVTLAATGTAVLKACEQAHFDLILMDIQMPEMDGLEATAVIRGREARMRQPRMPIIALTAYAMKGDRERCMAAGMDGYVSKPLQAAQLFEAIARIGIPCTNHA